MKLTDANVRNIKPRQGRAERLVADIHGLYLRVRTGPRGTTRTWQHRSRVQGKVVIRVLGTYPRLGLREARAKADALERTVEGHRPTVAEAAEDWLIRYVNPRQKRSDLTRGFIERAVVPLLGHRLVQDVAPVDVMGAVLKYRERVLTGTRHTAGGLTAALGLLVVCKGLFRFCVANGWIDQSPAAQLSAAALGPSAAARERVLTDREICSVLTETHRCGPVLRFLLATGLRISEAYDGHRDGEHWIVPSGASKNRREHRVWLSSFAQTQLEQYPWQARKDSVQHTFMRRRVGWSAHDLRRTFGTRLNAMGIAPHVVERALNHTLGGVAGVYNRAEYEPERREALEAWGRKLERMATVPGSNVIELPAQRERAA